MSDLPGAYLRGIEALKPIVGTSADSILNDRLRAFANPMAMLASNAKLDILLAYLARGAPVSMTEINELAERQVLALLLGTIETIKKEYGG